MDIKPTAGIFTKLIQQLNPKLTPYQLEEIHRTCDEGAGSEKTFVYAKVNADNTVNIRQADDSSANNEGYKKIELSDGVSFEELNNLGINPTNFKIVINIAERQGFKRQAASDPDPKIIDDTEISDFDTVLRNHASANRMSLDEALSAYVHSKSFYTADFPQQIENLKNTTRALVAFFRYVRDKRQFIAALKMFFEIDDGNPLVENFEGYFKSREYSLSDAVNYLLKLVAASHLERDAQEKVLNLPSAFETEYKGAMDLESIKLWAASVKGYAKPMPTTDNEFIDAEEAYGSGPLTEEDLKNARGFKMPQEEVISQTGASFLIQAMYIQDLIDNFQFLIKGDKTRGLEPPLSEKTIKSLKEKGFAFTMGDLAAKFNSNTEDVKKTVKLFKINIDPANPEIEAQQFSEESRAGLRVKSSSSDLKAALKTVDNSDLSQSGKTLLKQILALRDNIDYYFFIREGDPSRSIDPPLDAHAIKSISSYDDIITDNPLIKTLNNLLAKFNSSHQDVLVAAKMFGIEINQERLEIKRVHIKELLDVKDDSSDLKRVACRVNPQYRLCTKKSITTSPSPPAPPPQN